MDKVVADVVPHPALAQLHGVAVLRQGKVGVGVAAHVTPTTDVAANQADPQVLVAGTLGAPLLGHHVRRLDVADKGRKKKRLAFM